jgi:predicted Zn-dependent protease
MSGLFFNLGRSLGRVTVPAIRKSQWVWHSLAGTEAESIQAERELGNAMAGEMRTKLGAVGNPKDTELVSEIGRRLGACVRNKLLRFKVEVIRTASPMAVALPGGFIFVGASLLDLCERRADELAFVIGHEMAHVIRGHAFDRIVSRVGLDVLSSILSRGALSLWLRKTGLNLLQSAHSRDCELEADELGTRLAEAAGYDPEGAVRLLRRLQALRSTPQGVGDYFASHPPATERIAPIKTLWTR